MERERRDHQLDSWEWLHWMAGLPAKALPVNSQTGNGQLFTGRCILVGASITNTATTTGSLALLDNTQNSGLTAAVVELAGSGYFTGNFAHKGVLIEMGVYAVITTATILGSVYVVPLWDYPDTQPGH